MKKALTKVLNIVVDVLVVFVLIISVLMLVVTFTSKGEGKVPSVFGKAPIAVLTNSMHGDKPDDFDEGDLLICDIVDKNAKTEYKVGDVVTFQFDVNGDENLDYVTHRIYKVNKDGTYLTKGDNNSSYDQDPKNATIFPNISDSDILAVYNGNKIGGVGSVMKYLQTPLGFFLCVLLPMIIFFLYQAVRVVMNLVAYNKEKALLQAKEAIAGSDLTEEQKQKAIAEYLAAQQPQQSAETSAEGEAPVSESEAEEAPAENADEAPQTEE